MLIPKLYFDDSISNFLEGDHNSMKCDIYEKDNNYFVEMDLPGFKKDEIKIECDKGNLIITASKEESEDDSNNDKNYIRRERVYNKYSRSFYLGDIAEDEVSAKFDNGTLTVTIPKKQEADTKKYINID